MVLLLLDYQLQHLIALLKGPCSLLSPICLSLVKFDDCAGNEAVVLRSSDPLFGVRTDGSIFATGEVNLDEPIQFKLTAQGPHAHFWETVVQLALIAPPPVPQKENEVRCLPHSYAPRQLYASVYQPVLLIQAFPVRNEVKTSRGFQKDIAAAHG